MLAVGYSFRMSIFGRLEPLPHRSRKHKDNATEEGSNRFGNERRRDQKYIN